jgi:hypothetical protein
MATNISPRFNEETYTMRGHAGRKSDQVENHSRKINGKVYDFSRVTWANGDVAVRAFKGGTTNLVHDIESS